MNVIEDCKFIVLTYSQPATLLHHCDIHKAIQAFPESPDVGAELPPVLNPSTSIIAGTLLKNPGIAGWDVGPGVGWTITSLWANTESVRSHPDVGVFADIEDIAKKFDDVSFSDEYKFTQHGLQLLLVPDRVPPIKQGSE